MPKTKFYYDPDSLSYKKIKRKKRTQLGILGLFILSALVLGFAISLLMGHLIESPGERVAKRELEYIKLQYEVMDKRLHNALLALENVEKRDDAIYRLYFDTNPIPEEQRRSGFGGVNRYKKYEGYSNSKLVINAQQKIDLLEKAIVVQSKSLDEIISLAKEKEKFLTSIPAIQPVKNEDLTHVASGYGYRTDPFLKIKKFHYGMDFTAPRGTPVYASGDGVVKRADSKSAGYGKHIRIDHGFGYVSLYAHLNAYKVRVNQKVKRGDLIGLVGSTGRSEAPHLHYEIAKNNEKINPINFYYGNLSAEEYVKIKEKALLQNESLD